MFGKRCDKGHWLSAINDNYQQLDVSKKVKRVQRRKCAVNNDNYQHF